MQRNREEAYDPDVPVSKPDLESSGTTFRAHKLARDEARCVDFGDCATEWLHDPWHTHACFRLGAT